MEREREKNEESDKKTRSNRSKRSKGKRNQLQERATRSTASTVSPVKLAQKHAFVEYCEGKAETFQKRSLGVQQPSHKSPRESPLGQPRNRPFSK